MELLLNILLIGFVVSVATAGLLAMFELSGIFDLRTWIKNKWRSWYG